MEERTGVTGQAVTVRSGKGYREEGYPLLQEVALP